MGLGWKDDAARGEQLDLGRSLAQLLARSLAYLGDAVGDDRHHGERSDVTTRVDQFVRGAKIGASARLRQRLAGIKESRPDDGSLGQEPRGRVVSPAGLADGGEAVHQAVAQITRRGQRNFGSRIRDVSWAQRQSGDMRMRIDEPWHQRLAGKDDNGRVSRSDRSRGHPVDAVSSYEDIEA